MKRTHLPYSALVLSLLELIGMQQAFADARWQPAFFSEVGVPFLLLSGLALWLLAERGHLPAVAPSPSGTGLHFILVFLFTRALAAASPATAFALAPLVLLTSLTVLIPPAGWYHALRAAGLRALLPALLVIAAGPWLTHVLWEPLAQNAGAAAYHLLQFVGVAAAPRWCGLHYVIDRGQFSIALTESCAGLRGLLLFVFLFTTVRLLGGLPSSRWRALSALLAGAMLMLSLNVVRIALFLALGSLLAARIGDGMEARRWVLALHANLGWALYAIGLAFFFFALARSRRAATV